MGWDNRRHIVQELGHYFCIAVIVNFSISRKQLKTLKIDSRIMKPNKK